MRPKDVNQIGAWTFRLKDLEGNEIQVPPSGHFNALPQLTAAVISIMGVFDSHSGGEYTKKPRKLAKKEKLEWDRYVETLIQHQICVNNQGMIPCWSDGFGDDLHQKAAQVDQYIAKLPEGPRKVVQRAVQAVTPSHTPTLSGCSSCGGTQVFDPNVNNKGRAGYVNSVFAK